MSIVVIMNPNAGSADEVDLLQEALTPMGEITLHTTKHAKHATTLAQAAVEQGAKMVVAVGGDGTINEVVHGLVTTPNPPTLGIIPMGTGNDLARTLKLPNDPVQAFELLTTGRVHQLDVIKIVTPQKEHFSLNVAAGGFSGEVDEVLSSEMKASWGPLAYLRGAIEVVPDLTNYHTLITYDDAEPEEINALNIIVANCRTAAGGIQVAPTANPEDGLLDIVIVRYASMLELAGAAARLLIDANYLNSTVVSHRRARRVKVTATPGIWFNADGELLTNEPMEFMVVPQALPVVVGPQYVAEIELEGASNE